MTIHNPTHLSNWCVQAALMPLQFQDLPAEHRVEGNPRVGSAELGRLGDCAVGVWEMTVGSCTDVEVDEFFIVLSGTATVSFKDGSPDMLLKAGTVGSLKQGSATVWTVTETLRKVYVA